MDSENFTFKPVTRDTWPDMERFFESRGCPGYCWCMAWRKMEGDRSEAKRNDRKKAFRKYVDEGTPVGLLCYSGKDPVAWCSVAPRESYRELSGDRSLEKVWSLACFFIRKEYRERGLTDRLIQEALKYAAENGAQYLEAYPVDPDSPSYRFMGFKPLFEKHGFILRHRAGKRRYVMTMAIDGEIPPAPDRK